MAGLIPLMLSSGSRTSYISQPSPSSSRRSTIDFSQMTRPTPAKRSPKPLSLPVLPHTKADWRKAISEIKRLHIGKKYRVCSARCLEILDNLKDPSQVEPVFLIYLHFYAATSMEICARPLPSSSSFRASLFQQARTHFDRAALLIPAAEDSVVCKIRRPGSVGSSQSSTCHSPSDSITSRPWSPETPSSSPTNSVCSFEDLSAKSHSPATAAKRVKKVSFSLPKKQHFQIPSPIIRPDSPTLGFDDDYFQEAAAREELPGLPIRFQEVELPLHPIAEDQQLNEDTFLIARSVNRFCEDLTVLRDQLARHLASLDELLTVKPPPVTATTPSQLPKFSTSTTRARSNSAVDLRVADKQARIERLRQNGWQRQRFDARRYEELCENVMSELA
ncbi:hypothetical protein B0T22DRAFT_92237 [Podospora appendiculata]|uniref:Uncharacterized protein n=1 Tax=Podospora appendiculata TaxID=314037 RepID=A0AAE1CI94_9PEZI|nr:hypothetical protein B0T22DRAFT_92237 [Podospora appendiculata]